MLKAVRLGRKLSSGSSRPRAVLVRTTKKDVKDRIMARRGLHLRGSGVYLNEDLSPQEQAMRKTLVPFLKSFVLLALAAAWMQLVCLWINTNFSMLTMQGSTSSRLAVSLHNAKMLPCLPNRTSLRGGPLVLVLKVYRPLSFQALLPQNV